MKVATWNCNGALRKKLDAIDSLNADLLVIQECENPAESTKHYQDWAGNYLWIGANKNKGIGIFPKNGHHVEQLCWGGSYTLNGLSTNSPFKSWSSDELKLFLPFRLNKQYTMLGCWTKGSPAQIFGYMGQFWKYLQIHKDKLMQDNTIILGDFNSNAIWDKSDRWWNHTDTLAELSEIGVNSLYHAQYNEPQGKETQPTFFLHRNAEKPYHIDYVFLSNDLMSNHTLQIGDINEWLTWSDHMPLTFELFLPK